MTQKCRPVPASRGGRRQSRGSRLTSPPHRYVASDVRDAASGHDEQLSRLYAGVPNHPGSPSSETSSPKVSAQARAWQDIIPQVSVYEAAGRWRGSKADIAPRTGGGLGFSDDTGSMNQCRYKHRVFTNSSIPSVDGRTNLSTISDGASQLGSGHWVNCTAVTSSQTPPIKRPMPRRRLWPTTHRAPTVLNLTRRPRTGWQPCGSAE